MVDYKKELNPEQYNVVSQIYGPLLVLAGAGSGKNAHAYIQGKLYD